ncbi:MAG: hypothetical protein LBP39_01045 [Rickettsiales bacterium]|nr:hypothetical protein [Rickettsiales bacterium]
MPAGSKKTVEYFYDRFRNIEPLIKWRDRLDKTDFIIVTKRPRRVDLGNYGDYKSISGGVPELRFSFRQKNLG